ncbi:MAG: hypothetical protein ACRESR_07270, partial [Gammaproteobacteria bacterium]
MSATSAGFGNSLEAGATPSGGPRKRMQGRRGTGVVGAILAIALAGFALPGSAEADYTVHSPHVTAGKNEIEWNSFASWGTNPYSGASQETKFEFGRGMNAFWKSELEFSAKKDAGHSLQPSEFEFENIFQLTPRGKYWVDAGLYTEVEYARGGKYEITVGPIFSKRFGRFSARLNVFAAHEYGNDADAGISWQYRARIEYHWKPAISPLFEFYGKPLGRSGAWGRPRNQIGPG